MKIDKMILGDNQFFGVNHLSQDKGRVTGEKFKDIEEVRATMHYALEMGVTGVVLSTHPSIYKITDMMRNDPILKEKMGIYINVPYITKYVQMVTEMGIFNTVKTVLEGDSIQGKIKHFAKGFTSVTRRDYLKLMDSLIDIEVKPFHGLNIKSIFLHNALTDLALSYELDNVLMHFYEYVSTKHNVTPGFISLNLKSLDNFIKRSNIEDVIVMSSVNPLGFLLNPSLDDTKEIIKECNYQHIAMATLASGRVKPKEAYQELFSIGKIDSVVVGVSSKKHSEETFGILNSHFETINE